MRKFFDGVRHSTATTGTGTLTLGGAYSNRYLTAAEAGISDGDTVVYRIDEGNDFEIGVGTYTASGTQLSRDTVRKSKIGGTAGTSKMSLTTGNASVRLTIGAVDVNAMLRTDEAQSFDSGQKAQGRTNLGLGTASVLDEGTTAQFRNNTADKALSTDQVWAAAGYVSLTDGANIAVDFNTGFNFTVTLGGNRTLDNPTNVKEGQEGEIEVVQDGTGSRTLVFGSNWEFAGGTAPTLSTAAGAKDSLFYRARSSTSIRVSTVKAWS